MDGLDHLVKLIAFVKRDGLNNAFEQDLHYGGDVENVNFRAYPEPLRSLRHCLEESKLCMEALNSVKTGLAQKIRNLQKCCTPLVLEDGIQRIPDEILAHIFEAGHQMLPQSDSKFAIRVSHVSSRFRQVSLRIPLLWTRLSSDHPVDQIEAYLSRSCQSDLQVTIFEVSGHPDDKFRSAVQLMGPHSGRWSTLHLIVDPDSLGIIDEAVSTHFPRLRSIYHQWNLVPSSLGWDMPSLSRFEGYCSQFPSGVAFPFLSQLTCVELCFVDYDDFDMTSLAEALYRMSNLRNLSLDFENCEAADDDEDTALEMPNPHSFPIESVTITLRDSVAADVVTSLYEILEYLTASRVDISLLMRGDPHDLVMGAKLFHHASTVRLRIGLPCSLSLIINALYENCKTLQTLQIEGSSFNPVAFVPSHWPQIPSLRHVQFYDCIMLEENVGPMATGLLTCEEFQLLEFISCHKISEEYLLKLQDKFGERLTWSF
ncbi:hypothetical protein BD410DRAFT_902123 [Rickenella mellea]|uniref:F-box domain-containing protein n=1 Tax=Rickenella mellea TaxID=50990 RepID=A0A4Y7PLJ7_9AGAM|nr:hypothetical protein BD410DRAFT_902123 [Rickenella mellea]